MPSAIATAKPIWNEVCECVFSPRSFVLLVCLTYRERDATTRKIQKRELGKNWMEEHTYTTRTVGVRTVCAVCIIPYSYARHISTRCAGTSMIYDGRRTVHNPGGQNRIILNRVTSCDSHYMTPFFPALSFASLFVMVSRVSRKFSYSHIHQGERYQHHEVH